MRASRAMRQVDLNYTEMPGHFPDLRTEILRIVANDGELWSEWEMSATTPAGQPILRRGPVILTLRDGRIDWARLCIAPVDATV